MNVKRAVSLYSYQENFYLGRLDLEGCIAEAAKAGAEGIELIPEQNCADEYLNPSRAFIAQWNEWMEKYHTKPVCCDIFYDYKLYWNRVLTDAEQVQMYEKDIRFAQKLGFPMVRPMITTPLRILEKTLPVAEEYGVKLAVEVHSPYSLKGKEVQGIFELADRKNSKYLGIVPDTGIYVRSQSQVIVDKFIRAGASREIADFLCRSYEQGLPQVQAFEQLRAMNPNEIDMALYKRVYFAINDDPEYLLENTDKIFHIHGKCWHMLPDCTEPAVDYERFFEALKRSSFSGYLATEYEGQRYFHDVGCTENADEIEEVRRHQQMLRRYLGD